MLPARFKTGVRNTTVANPAQLPEAIVSYQGKCSGYHFKRQTENFNKLRAVLVANGDDFKDVAAALTEGDVGSNHRLVATTKTGRLLWYKYVGYAAQSGQNHVYVNGWRVKVSIFLAMTSKQQKALLTGVGVGKAFSKAQQKLWNEADTLWN